MFRTYLRSQSSLLDLWDVGVGCIQRVKIHFVELVVESHSKLPRQVIMAEISGNQRVIASKAFSQDSHHKL